MITKQKSLFVLLFVILICGCSKEDLNAQSSKRNGQEATMNNQTGFSLSVPSEYTRQVSQRGSATRLDYTSKDYAGNGKAITKTAYVYTPYGYNEKGSGYFIYHAVGTNDAVKEQSYMMAEEMLSRKTFSSEHYVFYQKQDGIHDHFAVREFLYNALPVIFGK